MSSKKDRNANINTARQQHTNVGTLLYRHVTFTTQYKAILLPCAMLTPVIALPANMTSGCALHIGFAAGA